LAPILNDVYHKASLINSLVVTDLYSFSQNSFANLIAIAIGPFKFKDF